MKIMPRQMEAPGLVMLTVSAKLPWDDYACKRARVLRDGKNMHHRNYQVTV